MKFHKLVHNVVFNHLENTEQKSEFLIGNEQPIDHVNSTSLSFFRISAVRTCICLTDSVFLLIVEATMRGDENNLSRVVCQIKSWYLVICYVATRLLDFLSCHLSFCLIGFTDSSYPFRDYVYQLLLSLSITKWIGLWLFYLIPRSGCGATRRLRATGQHAELASSKTKLSVR